jgi:hypothetical protein
LPANGEFRDRQGASATLGRSRVESAATPPHSVLACRNFGI